MIDTDVDDVDSNAMLLDFQYAPDSCSQHCVWLDWFDEDLNFNDFGFLRRNNYCAVCGQRLWFHHALCNLARERRDLDMSPCVRLLVARIGGREVARYGQWFKDSAVA